MKVLAPALLLAAVWTVPASAQTPRGTIVGTITEARTGEPLAATHVALIEAHRSETTMPDGGFAFPAVTAGTHTLAVERIGYAPLQVRVTVEAGRTTTVRVEL